MFELALTAGCTVILIAFAAEYVDSTLGMGYGTTLTPLLMLMGYEPLQIVPAILVSELLTGISAGFTHHAVGNVRFLPRTMSIPVIITRLRQHGIREGIRRGTPLALKIALVIGACSLVGTVASVMLAVSLPKFYLKLYIGLLVTGIGLIILCTLKKNYAFSWKKITGLGVIASFNKGLSGGGYGPVVTGGQLLAGVDDRNAIGITSLSEGLTCLVGVIAYLMSGKPLDWILAPYLIIGALISVPFSAVTVRKLPVLRLRVIIGILTVTLGLFTLYKIHAFSALMKAVALWAR